MPAFTKLVLPLVIVTIVILGGGNEVSSLEPITTGAAFGAAMFGSLYSAWNYKLKCALQECCPDPKWVTHNVSHFESLFDQHVFGQHIVKDVVAKALRSHVKKESPKKALVLSFHGWTGSGKNYVAQFIAQSLFREGMKSKFVNLFISTVDFPIDEKVDIYKLDVQDRVRSSVQECPQSLFIFDEIDKMPIGLVDAIKPFIDYHEEVQGIDYRRSVFVFLSNTGGKAITDVALEAWHDGLERESITYETLERAVSLSAHNEAGGLYHSALIDKHLIDRYVPFLPMERKHVQMCIIAQAYHTNSTIDLRPEEVNEILDELLYWPEDYQVFSSTGCKTVAPKVDYILERIIDERESN